MRSLASQAFMMVVMILCPHEAIAQTVIVTYPYKIVTPGSYKLGIDIHTTGTVIEIAADNVTLDMAGHIIDGGLTRCVPRSRGNSCSVTTGQPPSIKVQAYGARITNGIVRLNSGPGIAVFRGLTSPDTAATLENITVTENYDDGILIVGNGTILRNVAADLNARSGVRSSGGTMLESVRASRNNDIGIYSGSGTTANQISAFFNGQAGAFIDTGIVNALYSSGNGAMDSLVMQSLLILPHPVMPEMVSVKQR